MASGELYRAPPGSSCAPGAALDHFICLGILSALKHPRFPQLRCNRRYDKILINRRDATENEFRLIYSAWLISVTFSSTSLLHACTIPARRLRSSTVGGYEPVPTNSSNTKRRRGSRGVRGRFNDTHGEEEASSSSGAHPAQDFQTCEWSSIHDSNICSNSYQVVKK